MVELKEPIIKREAKGYGTTFENELKAAVSVKKKQMMRIWGSNPERLRKLWGDYMAACQSPLSLWTALYILRTFLDKFIRRKEEQELEQKRK